MKKLLVLLYALAIVSCKEEPKDYAIISGKIENTSRKQALVTSGDFKHEVSINAEGEFIDTLRIPEARFYNFSIGQDAVKIYMDQGDKLSFTTKIPTFVASIEFKGDKRNENNYLANKTKVDTRPKAGAKKIYELEENVFKSKLNDIKAENLAKLTALKGIDEKFKTYETQNLTYDTFVIYGDYENAHRYFTQNQSFEVSENFLPEDLRNIEFNNTELYKMSDTYRELAFNTSLNSTFESLDDGKNIKPSDLEIIKNIQIQDLKNDVIDFVSPMLLSPENKSIEQLHTFFIRQSTDDGVKQRINTTYEKNKKLLKGMPSPRFVNYENNAGGETSLTDLKGKYVYIDVWATWCGPCIGEIPSLKKVENKYHNKNIEFVSTSIDTPNAYEKWKNMIIDKDLGGIQLLADNAWQSQFVKDYAIDGIPRFILIDPNGNIVSADAPRPSDPKLVKLIDNELASAK